MSRAILLLTSLFLLASAASAQESGNRAYGGQQTRPRGPLTGELLLYDPKDQTVAPYVDAYVLMNVKADAFVAVFGLAQEGPTAAESNRKVDAQLAEIAAAFRGLGVQDGDLYVDFISQNPVYDYSLTGKTAREALTGFQTKKTLAARYRDRALLEKLIAAAAKASVYDLIKVDYVVSDPARVRARLLEEASRVLKEKIAGYGRLLGVGLKPRAVAQEKYQTFTPDQLYLSYIAYESGSAEGASRVVERRKSMTTYYEPLEGGDFDAVIEPAGIEPTIQCTLFLKVRCEWVQP